MEQQQQNEENWSKLNDHGLDSVLNLQGSPQNFPIISILTKPNVTASVEMSDSKRKVNKKTSSDHIINYALLRFTSNNNNNNADTTTTTTNKEDDDDDDDDDMQIGFRIDTTSIVDVNKEFPDYGIDICSEAKNGQIGRFAARGGKKNIDIVRTHDGNIPLILRRLKSRREYSASDLKKLFDKLVKSRKGFRCISIKVTNGLMREIKENEGPPFLRLRSKVTYSGSKIIPIGMKYSEFIKNKFGITVTWKLIMVTKITRKNVRALQ